MSRVIYKSIRCLVFGVMLLFAGATDMFSVDLDSDGDVDTDAVVAFDQANAVRASVPAPEEQTFSSGRPISIPAGVPAELTQAPVPPDISGPALSSPQLLIPLRT